MPHRHATMKRIRRTSAYVAALIVCAFAYGSPASAQIPLQQGLDLERADVDAALDRTAYVGGERAGLSVRISIDDEWHTNSNQPTYQELIATEVTLEPPPEWPEIIGPRYPEGEMKSFSFTEFPISVYEGDVFIRADLDVPADAATGTYPIRATVTYQACDDKMCLAPVTTATTVGLNVGTGGTVANAEFFGAMSSGGGQASTTGPSRGILWFILLGFLGGLILNAMPCVLPILSLKVFGLVKSAEGGRGAVAAGSLATAAGILISFLLLAAAAIIARSAGVAVGWGIQFQEPVFVGSLAVVMLLFTLNLWGLFEIPLPRWMGQLGASGPSEGIAGHLTTGFFATLMATPCSAPFLGTALGFALTRDTGTTLTMFSAIGTGMASPYLLLAAFPAAGRLLPKPGDWMNTFKVVMGFFLAATLVWLLFVLSGLVPATQVAFFELALLGIALTVWLATRAGAKGVRRVAAVATIALVVLGVGTVAGARSDLGPSTLGVAPEDRLIDWQPFDWAEAEQLAAEGKYVFVDVTADWCFTCKVNERLFLETDEVAGAFEDHGVIAMKADWTRRDDTIGEYLATFDRYGIPFYVLYRPGQEPHVFSELLSKAAVTELLSD